jgi:hypothetical protein
MPRRMNRKHRMEIKKRKQELKELKETGYEEREN